MEVNLTEILERLITDRKNALIVAETAQKTAAALEIAIKSLQGQQKILGGIPLTTQTTPKALPITGTKPKEEHPSVTLNRDAERLKKVKEFLAGGPKSTREIALMLGANKEITKSALQRLRKTGDLDTVGEKNGQKWLLPHSKAG